MNPTPDPAAGTGVDELFAAMPAFDVVDGELVPRRTPAPRRSGASPRPLPEPGGS